jgi:hypothetical protein
LVKQVKKVRHRLKKLGKKLRKDKHKTNASAEAIEAALKYADMADDLSDFFEKETYYKKKEAYLKSIEPCFNTLTKLRTNSLCTICSGRAEKFVENNRLRISKDTCVEVVKSCATTWSFIYQFMQNAKAISTISRVYKTIKRGKKGKKFSRRKSKGPDTSAKSGVIV